MKNKWNSTKYKNHASFVSDMAIDLVEVLNPKKDEEILDLGCGDGTLSLEIQKYKANIIAVDLSEQMIKKAKSRGLEAYVMSATDLNYEEKFDAVFSNAVLHWVKDKDIAVQNIKKVLKPKGRFVAEFGGYKNVQSIVDAISEVFDKNKQYGEFNNPWYFPSVEQYKEVLEQNGFKINFIKLIPRPTPIDDVSNWLKIFANGIISHLTKKEQEHFIKQTRDILKDKIYSNKEGWVVDYIRLRVEAVKINN